MRSVILFFGAAGRGPRLVVAVMLAASLVGAGVARAQGVDTHCLLLPIEPARRAQQSVLVVEAEVLDAQSFWDATHQHLFTRHRLRVFSLLKGALADTTGLRVITEGGRLGLDQQVLTNTLQLWPGQQGIFFLKSAPWSGAGPVGFVAVASQQGFIEFNPAEGTAAEPFRTYPALDAAFYQAIARLTGQLRQVVRANPALAAPATARRGTLAPSIAGFSPLSLTAGTGAVLTIDGDGFGSSRGSGFVEFKNADDGGATRVKARDTDYLTWTNTRIRVRVPSSSGGRPAGSGQVRVTVSGQLPVESAGTLTVVYALTNVESTTGNLLQRPNHVALNSTGGLTFRFGPNFTSSPAPPAWQRALATWRCQTGMNWEVGNSNSTNTNTIADDGQNIVAFDNGPELPDRVLGRTTTYYRGCFAPTGELVFWVKEIDVQFDDAAVFQFGPAPPITPQLDFESVAVHELGHAQQLAHLNLPGAVMNFAIGRGQSTRSLSPASDVAGGRQVLRARSFRNLGCDGPALLPAPLTAFSARYEPAIGTTVSWATRDECFLNGFVVERSQGGDTINWVSVATLATLATRAPTAQYQVVDSPPTGGLLYYRLRLRRPDGSLDNTALVVLSTDGTNASVSIFPNPVTDNFLRLQYPAIANGPVVLRVYDALGRLVRVSTQATMAGLNELPLNVAGLVPGFFVLFWQDASGRTGQQNFVRL